MRIARCVKTPEPAYAEQPKDFTCDTCGGGWSGTVIRPRYPADVPENDLVLMWDPA
jgi:hypothetical protein